ncbi:PTB_TBC1D1_like and TBC domain-containing protein plx isoform X2 [Choristoneura fumiferana]|uniref:PTB_TBC1D1_like and TBC domain-containing protein plx isoform X2 n=1 Tax=Choristoneura fumiferana TaxID=7141 RepID=UPI003D156E4C
MNTRERPLFGSHSDTSAIKIKHMVTDLFTQMREPSPGAPSPRSSTSSLHVTRNAGFQQQAQELPWQTSAISLPRNCNSNLASEPSLLMRSTSNESALTSLCADLSPSDSHFFEVLYIGKVRISQRKVPESLIDDALIKFAQHEADKAKNRRRHSLLSSTGTSIYTTDSTENLTDKKTESLDKKLSESVSNTPLEPDKNLWKSTNNLPDIVKTDNTDVDQEFENFTKERVNGRKNNDVIFNVPNLGTVKEDEEKNEEIRSIISETASSITQFCQTNFLSDKEFEKQDKNITEVVDPLIFKENTRNKLDLKLDLNEKATIAEADGSNNITFEEIKTVKSKEGVDNRRPSMPENKSFLRDRSASIGNISLNTPITQVIGEQNRTMLFQVGRSELRLISPDRKQILLHRAFKDVASCVLGRFNKDHFGFVCRETNESYAAYVFKCESVSVANEVVNAIKQAFVAHAEILKKSREKSPNMTCEHCPMLWYHRLCHDVEGMNEKKTHAFILRRIEQLPEDEQDLIITKYQGGTNHMYEVSEHNAFLMMLLRAHCEEKQTRHVHDTAENRSEFLNQYLGGTTIFMKARRSLTSGFDHFLKRKASRDDGILHVKKEASPLPTTIVDTASDTSVPEILSPDNGRCKSLSPAVHGNGSSDPPPSPKPSNMTPPAEEEEEELKEEVVNSPMMDIFLKVSDNRPAPTEQGIEPDATWRQAIYEKVLQPTDVQGEVGDLTPQSLLNLPTARPGKRSREELRLLWKMAIEQTVLLVRMERENAKLKQSEESSAVRRIKLEYTELGVCDAAVAVMWDSLLASRDRLHPVAEVDRHMLTQAVIQGVPRMTRGGVWYFLAEQACLRSPPPDAKLFPNYQMSYKALLAGLTKHQHAILIDLGRTFPQHSYFASALGPGQLALYNILKAYSLLDPDVGYCQGLSFVAGVLLLHTEEAEAFILLRHLMFRRGLRKQYLPDMSALQVQLYQLSRLLRDHEPELHARLEALDISPALYAAPWMLTLFTSQFPLGFVVRVFDLIFLESLDIVFSVSLALLSAHRDGLMLCESCEEAAEYLKHKLPDINKGLYEKVMKKVMSLDISRQLCDYAVEYAVLREEMPRLASVTEDNRRLVANVARMSTELDSAMDAITNFQNSQARLESINKSMEQQLTLLSRYISAHQRQEMPTEIKKIVQNHSKKISFGSKIFSSKFTLNDDDDDPKKNFKTGISAPNLFAKITKEDVYNAANRDKKSPELDKKHFLSKKSQSVNNLKPFPLKVLEEKSEDMKRTESFRNNNALSESLNELGRKNTGYFANTHEQIRRERLFEQQLKHDFDENLKKSNIKIAPKDDDLSIFQSRRSMSLNLGPKTLEPKFDSGFVTPISPEKKEDTSSVISHPLSDCDVEIKFDGQSTALKQIRSFR